MNRLKSAVLKPAYKWGQEVYRDIENSVRYRRRSRAVPRVEITNEKNVLLLVVDCLRADHVSGGGYDRETTPFLDEHAEFRVGISAAPWTYPAVPSILTGRYPHNHGAVFTEDLRNEGQMGTLRTLVDDAYTVPEILNAAGYESFFATAIPTAEIATRGRLPSRQISQHAPAEWLTDELINWWEQTRTPRFGYVHFGDLHEPLSIPDEEPFGPIPDIEGIDQWRFTEETEPEDEFAEYRRERIRLYDTHIRKVDRQIERIVNHLEHANEFENTLVLVVGDHGEEFWEWASVEKERFYSPRGIYGVGHGHALFPEVIDVPIMLLNNTKLVGEGLVSTVDVQPTILEELGVSTEEIPSVDGIPVSRSEEDRVLLSEEIAYGYNQTAVVRGDDHLIHSPHDGETLLLNRSTGELKSDQETVEELLDFTTYDRQAGELTEVDENTQQRLADLGYK